MAMAKGLGKGLDALMGDSATMQNQEAGSVTLPISQVEPGLNQPRKWFDEDALADLAASIREHGIIQPLTVRRLSTGYYQIIAGERRWRAAKLAGRREVPVVIIEADDRKVMELGLIENLQREDLNPAEEARGYRTLMEEYGLTQEQAAQRVGKSRSAVANVLRLLNLSPALRQHLESGRLSAGHARALLPLSPEIQEAAAAEILRSDLSVRQTEQLVKRLQQEKQEKPAKKHPTVDYVAEAERSLSDTLGRACHIAHGRKKGRVEIEYYGTDDLNDLLDALALLKLKRRDTEK